MDIAERLVMERRSRLAAERLLEQKSRELFAANEKLGMHARSLSDQIVVAREVTRSALSEAEALKESAQILRPPPYDSSHCLAHDLRKAL